MEERVSKCGVPLTEKEAMDQIPKDYWLQHGRQLEEIIIVPKKESEYKSSENEK